MTPRYFLMAPLFCIKKYILLKIFSNVVSCASIYHYDSFSGKKLIKI